jgi:hypothetical protein
MALDTLTSKQRCIAGYLAACADCIKQGSLRFASMWLSKAYAAGDSMKASPKKLRVFQLVNALQTILYLREAAADMAANDRSPFSTI